MGTLGWHYGHIPNRLLRVGGGGCLKDWSFIKGKNLCSIWLLEDSRGMLFRENFKEIFQLGAFWYNCVMNNFQKYCAFCNYFRSSAHGLPQVGGGGEIRRLPHWKKNSICGALSPCGGPFFSFWGPKLFLLLENTFSMRGTFFIFMWRKVLDLSPLTTISAGVHAIAARVVANMLLLWNLREIARLNLVVNRCWSRYTI